ncbi:protein kinase [Myxococcota bacterium]|nr:protein kinase [Myxococcota bacterium]
MTSHRLGRYTLLEELAQGGMSRIFVAQKDGADDICVLKQLLVELRTNEVAAKRFYREAHIASFLDHPNIARLIGAGFEDDCFCLAMEYIPGADLDSILRALPDHRLPWELGVTIALFVLDALAYAHAARDPDGRALDVVHRDVAPRNIMVGFGGHVKLIDFGLARGKVDAFATEPGVIMGTLRYISPEQARSEEVDKRSDLYSLGVVVYELLTGQKIVQEKTPLAALRTIMEGTPPLMRALNPSVPAEIEIAVARALEKQPRDRWQTADEMKSALLEAVGPSFAWERAPELGDLVRRLFPEGEQRARSLVAVGRRRFASVYGRDAHLTGTLTEGQMRSHQAATSTTLPGDEEPTFALDRPPDASDAETTLGMDRARPFLPTAGPASTPTELGDGDTIPIPMRDAARAIAVPIGSPEATLDGRVRAPSTALAPRPPTSTPQALARSLAPIPRSVSDAPTGSGPGIEEETALSAHPVRRQRRRRVVFVALAAAALLVALPIVLEQCDAPETAPIEGAESTG